MAFEVARVHGLICSNIEDSLQLNDAMRPVERAVRGGGVGELQRGVRTSSSSSCLPSPIRVAYEPSLCGQLSSSEASSGSSPLDSSACSTETESDDDDNELFASLAEHIAHSIMLADDDNSSIKKNAAAAAAAARESKFPHDLWNVGHADASELAMSVLSGPATNKTGGRSWFSASAPSSKGSSRVSSQVASPPTTPLSEQSNAWDLLYLAAGEVVSLKTNEQRAMTLQAQVQQQQAHQVQEQAAQAQWNLPSVRMPVPGMPGMMMPSYIEEGMGSETAGLRNTHAMASIPKVVSPRDRPATTGAHLQRSWSSLGRDEHRKPCWNQFQAGKTHSPTGWAQQSRRPSQQLQQRSFLGSQNGSHHQSCNSLQQSAAAGYGVVPAVFLGTGRTGRESSGTGVFLPRSLGNASDRRKPCYPASMPSSPTLSSSSQQEMSRAGLSKMCHKDHVWCPPDRKLHASSLHHQAATPAELSLPSEWTY